ncbi:hypothetical protein [Crocosphaera sp.]|uniref:hypothetical protein n=1 Tax=Crocosphaera sp. TaxID=2729996 RepID=UPI0026320F65|nr:hypothetical protein [Crocosphaera sp.]MDJ0582966.1 hypothetical protein [Crocosphaera sp.]
MTEAPLYTVFLDKEKVKDIDLSFCPDGIPCEAYSALDREYLIPKEMVFLVALDKLNAMEKHILLDKYGESDIFDPIKGDIRSILIPFEDVLTAVDSYGNSNDLTIIKQSWMIENNAQKIPLMNLQVDGTAIHLLVVGLQQGLFLDSDNEDSINKLILPIIITFIRKLSKRNSTIEEAYLIGFPDEYVNQARHLLSI